MSLDLKQILSDLDSSDEMKIVKRTRNLPLKEDLTRVVLQLKRLLFPGYFGKLSGARLDLLSAFRKNLVKEVKKGLHYVSQDEKNAITLVDEVVGNLGMLKKMLYLDILAALKGDPATSSKTEILIAYPGINALFHYRFAHLLYTLKVPLIPRFISELAHSLTAIDIHPGAVIGKGFFIDHGTGVVIGETAIIGDNVTIYQGVTLGARNFAKDASGSVIKGTSRHPIIEDNVVIYAGATILGRITIGKNSIIGGNVWITKNVASDSTVLQVVSK